MNSGLWPSMLIGSRAFLIQVFICVLAILAVSFFLHPPPRKTDTPWKEQIKRIDFLGALLLILIVFVILFGLDQGSNLSWHSPVAIVPLCATVPLVLAFLWVETRFASEPFTPGHVIFDKALCACYVQNFFGYAGFTAFIFYIPFFFEAALEMTPAQAGVGLIPAAISAVVGTLLGGLILKRIGKFYWLALIASGVGTVAAVPIAVAPSLKHGSAIAIYVASVVTFVPLGMTITASLIAISGYILDSGSPKLMSRSIERICCRPSGCHRLFLSLSFPRRGCWCLLSWSGHSAGPGHEATSEVGSGSRQPNPRERFAKFKIHQRSPSGFAHCRGRMLP